jgi:hypothetical protein
MGAVQTFQSGPTPVLAIHSVEGNLNLAGWDRPEVQVRVDGDDDALTIEQHDGTFTIECEDNLWLRVPVQTAVTIGVVEGNASISLLLGGLTIETIEGSAAIQSVGAFNAACIEGNFAARLIAGELAVKMVEGNAQIAKVAGGVQLDMVQGNLVLDESSGAIDVTVEGNAKVQTMLAEGQHCTVRAEGNITCDVPHNAGGVFSLKADGAIRIRNFGDERTMRSGEVNFERQPAHARITLAADGNILLRGAQPRAFDAAEFSSTIEDEMAMRSVEIAQQISAQIESQVNELSRQLDDKLSRLGNNEEFAVTIQERVQSAMRRAEEKLAEAMRKMEQRTQESESRRRKGNWPAPPPPPAAPKPKRSPATDEERMMILRMVEQGKLSVEQAESLLAALNGGKQER